MSVEGAKGGVSGGTAASGMQMFEELAEDPELRKMIADPYVLAPVDHAQRPEAAGDESPDARRAVRGVGWRRS